MSKKEQEVQQEVTEPSKRDMFRERFSKRYPDTNMDDEDAYYDAAMKHMDSFEQQEGFINRMREGTDKSPLFTEMIMAAGQSEDFDPLVWFIEQGVDLDAIANDPAYAEKIGEARKKQLKMREVQEGIDKEAAENTPKSIQAILQRAEALGLSDEQTEEIITSMYQMMDDMIHGKISLEMFELLAKGKNADRAVEEAREEGKAEGLNTKVNDKLRKLPTPTAKGRQTPIKEAVPKNKPHNPFLA